MIIFIAIAATQKDTKKKSKGNESYSIIDVKLLLLYSKKEVTSVQEMMRIRILPLGKFNIRLFISLAAVRYTFNRSPQFFFATLVQSLDV